MEARFTSLDISVHMETALENHFSFLQLMDQKSKWIHRDDVVRTATRRYETLWLPLVAKHKDDTNLEPPDDIHWVWHVHMLCPKKYFEDCHNIINMMPDHKLRHTNERRAAKIKTAGLWQIEYPEEPYEFDFGNSADYCFQSYQDYTSQISYDISQASERQRVFYYSVSLSHYKSASFIKHAILRYKKFVNLKKVKADAFIVPMYDVDLVWHTHQLYPVAYRRDIQAFLGYVMNHDDTTTDRSEGSTLTSADDATRKLWLHTYQETFPIPGVMYRGISSSGVLASALDTISTKLKKKASLSVTKIKLTGDSIKDKFMISGKMTVSGHNKVFNLPTLKKPPFVWEIEGLYFDTETNSPEGFHICFTRHDGIKGRLFGKSWISSRLKPQDYLDSVYVDTKGGSTSKFCMTTKPMVGVKLGVKCNVEKLHLQDELVQVRVSAFQPRVLVSQDVWQWAPTVTIPRIKPDIEVSFSQAVHRVTSQHGGVTFAVKVVHCLVPQMSVVSVASGEDTLVVAQLIGSAQLPTPQQMGGDGSKHVTLDTHKGERAFLIKNHCGDWGIVKAMWRRTSNSHSANTANNTNMKNNSGYLAVKFTHLKTEKHYTCCVLKDESGVTNETFKIFHSVVDLRTGHISLIAKHGNIAENLALSFCISLLYILCELKSEQAPRTSTMSQLTMLQAAGYGTEIPSNTWMRDRHKMKPTSSGPSSSVTSEKNRDSNREGSMLEHSQSTKNRSASYRTDGQCVQHEERVECNMETAAMVPQDHISHNSGGEDQSDISLNGMEVSDNNDSSDAHSVDLQQDALPVNSPASHTTGLNLL